MQRNLRPILFILLGGVIGMFASRYYSSKPSSPAKPAPAPASAKTSAPVSVNADSPDMKAFQTAVKTGDFAALRTLGQKLFPKGALVRDPDRLFAGYEANNIAPYRVFAFLSEQSREQARRVMLTLDGEGRVESFMAEEMPVVK